ELAESVRPKTPPVSSEGAKSKGASSGLVGDEKVTSEVVLRISATDRGDLTKRVQEVKPGTAYFMKKKPSQETRYTSQIRSVMRPSASVAPSTDSISEIQAPSSVPDPAPVVREPAQLTEENLRILEEEVQAKTEEVRRLLPIGQGVLLGKALEKSKEKESLGPNQTPLTPMSTEAKGIPTSAVPVNKPKAKSRPLTEEQKAIAEENLAQKASDMIREVDKAKLAEAKRATAEFKSARAAEKRAIDTLNSEEEAAEKYRRIQEARIKKKQESTASASGVKKSVKPGYLEHLTEDQFRTELSSEREAQEEEERRKAREQARTELEKE
ncbi:unnamed protein product, partial [Durusdinium trenchii]